MRFFMGVGKYTPNDAIAGDIGWKPAYIRQWSNVFRHWARCSIMEHDRINFKVFKRSIKRPMVELRIGAIEFVKC